MCKVGQGYFHSSYLKLYPLAVLLHFLSWQREKVASKLTLKKSEPLKSSVLPNVYAYPKKNANLTQLKYYLPTYTSFCCGNKLMLNKISTGIVLCDWLTCLSKKTEQMSCIFSGKEKKTCLPP